MPCNKKKEPPPICTSTSRRLLHSLTIHDIPQGRIICMPSSLSPSPSVSRMCICDQEECTPPICCHLKNNEDDIRNGQPQEHQTPVSSPACKDGVTVDSLLCCRDILRKLAQEVLPFSDSQLDKRVCIRDNKSEATPPCCIPSKPVTSLPECSMKTCPISKASFNSASKKDSCCDKPDCQDTEILAEPSMPRRGNGTKSTPREKSVVQREDVCSMTSCTRDISLKSKSSKWTNTESGDSSTKLSKRSDSTANATPKLLAMPSSTPIPSRRASSTIGKNSSMKLLGGVSKSEEEAKSKKSLFKLFGRSSKSKVKNDDVKEESNKSKSKEEKNKASKKKDDKTASCTNMKCKTNTCTCRFPPAYKQYYDCTGQISGICHCERDNFPNM